MAGRVILIVMVGVVVAAPRTAVPAVEVMPHACEIAGKALCATYVVWEDRDRKAGRRIGLNIVILPALSSDKAADPLFIFEGGPGGAATELGRDYADERTLRAHRDIVLIDQRGTGGSNPLDCDVYGEPEDLQKVVGETFPL